MATRVCPNCGSQYVASVRRCIDCDIVLEDEVGTDGEAVASGASPVGAGGQIAYELEGWGSQLKVTLEGMLDRAGIRRVWEAGALVVPAEHEEEVDLLVATVEGGDVPDLDDDAPMIAFEIEGLTPDELADLDARLIADHVAHSWDDEGALLVSEDDEERVAEIIDAVLAGEADDQGDGLAHHEALSALFVAVDKLAKDPFDEKLVARFSAAVEPLGGLGVPYGLSGDEWSVLVSEAEAVLVLVASDADADDDESEDVTPADDEPVDDEAEQVDTDQPDEDDQDDQAQETPLERARRAASELRERLRDLV